MALFTIETPGGGEVETSGEARLKSQSKPAKEEAGFNFSTWGSFVGMTRRKLTIETSDVGLERVVVHLNHDEPADAGLNALSDALPALSDLDRRTRRRRRISS